MKITIHYYNIKTKKTACGLIFVLNKTEKMDEVTCKLCKKNMVFDYNKETEEQNSSSRDRIDRLFKRGKYKKSVKK